MALVLNKIDKVKKENLIHLATELNALFSFENTYMISALKNDGVQKIVDQVCEAVPAGPFHFEADEISTLPHRVMAAEITREKLFYNLHQEIPYHLTVQTDEWEEFDNGDIKLHQTILIDRATHKPIILGKGGQTLKKIGMQSRQELERIFETKVHLKLFVRLQEDWTETPDRFLFSAKDISANT
jgi:GTP-binding protein Era